LSRVEPSDLPGLKAWRIQRRRRIQRAVARTALILFAVSASAAALPAAINPYTLVGVHIGLSMSETDAAREARAADLAQRLTQRAIPAKPLPKLSDREPAPLPPSGLSAADLGCLAKALFGEARGDNIEAQMAVGQVIMTHAKQHGGSVCQAIAKAPKCFFPHTCVPAAKPEGMRNQWQQALWVAEEVAAGRAHLRELAHAERFHSYLVGPDWKASMRRVRRIGGLIFYSAHSAPDPDLTMAMAKPKGQWDEPPSMFWADIQSTERLVEVLALTTEKLPQPPKAATIRRAPATPTGNSAASAPASTFNPFANANQH
jgi:spore germination cell wall hydrolase CwlJ-like protein